MTEPFYRDGQVTIYNGDCRDVLPGLTAGAIVTDPPYELGFMGKAWDRTGIAFDPATWRAVHDALTPGGYLLAFGGSRTFHRIACAIEDGGFELRDVLMWLYGSGFPKSRALLKPAYEPIALARRPGPLADLAIDDCRIAGDVPTCTQGQSTNAGTIYGADQRDRRRFVGSPAGRWPANVLLSHADGCEERGVKRVRGTTGGQATPKRNGDIFAQDEYTQTKMVRSTVGHADPDGLETVPAWACVEGCPVGELDRQSGSDMRPGEYPARRSGLGFGSTSVGTATGERVVLDRGGASRFYYVAKASRRERGEGNDHPTVKPIALMRWLVRLVTPDGATVVDPFCGSGSTLLAAVAEGRPAVGIDSDPHACEIAARRVAEATRQRAMAV